MPDVINILFNVALVVVGAFIIISTLISAIKTFVMPRSANVWLTRQVFQFFGSLFAIRRRKATSYEEQDRLMAMFAPTALISMPVVWMLCVWIGYALIFMALGYTPLSDALRLSGSSLLTLGIVAPLNFGMSLIAFSEAVLGLLLMALLIGYLPTMYATFSKRELAVNLLEVRAGSPPSAVELIQRAYRIRGLDSLSSLWIQWESWFAELEETHTSLAALVFFRSPTPDHSWVTAAGAVLDAAALMSSTVDVPRAGERELCIRAGYLALRHIADFFRIDYDPTPQATDQISIARDEFDTAYNELKAAGVPVKSDIDQCWRDFSGWRVNYDRVLLAIAMLTIAPYAPWSSDRGLPDMRPGSPASNKRKQKEKVVS